VKRRQVLFTATARGHVLRERDWWVTNRESVDAFASDLDRALDLIATLPGVGSRYPRIPGMRRILLERVAVHVYFTFDGDSVIVRAVWGARRRRGPRLADEP
jgi:plasmid stabilization system protein ParE